MENYKCKSVGIVGSGIQGVCTALQLVKKGSVTIFDIHDPLSKNLNLLPMEMQSSHLMLFYNSIVQMFFTMFLRCC